MTWRDFVAAQGAGERDLGLATTPETLRRMDEATRGLALEPDDLREIRLGDETLLKASQVRSAVEKFAEFDVGPRFTALVKEELHDRLNRRLAQMARNDELQEEMLGLDVERQYEIFGETLAPDDEDETVAFAKRYVEHLYEGAHDAIEGLAWLRFDRIGMRMLGARALSATEWLYLRLIFTGIGSRDARFVMVDEVQDYTEAQLMVLARFFSSRARTSCCWETSTRPSTRARPPSRGSRRSSARRTAAWTSAACSRATAPRRRSRSSSAASWSRTSDAASPRCSERAWPPSSARLPRRTRTSRRCAPPWPSPRRGPHGRGGRERRARELARQAAGRRG